jgi:hypothetical protein
MALSKNSGSLVDGMSATSAVRVIRRPSLDLRAQPELDSAVTEVQDRPRHVCVPMLINAHGVSVSKPEQLRDAVGIHQIVEVHLSAHGRRLLS